MAVGASFDINAALRLQAPANIDLVVKGIQSKLNTITANIQIGIPVRAKAEIDLLNKRLQTLSANLSSVKTNADLAAIAISGIGSSLHGTSTRLSNLQQYLKSVSSGFANIGRNTKPAGDT